MNGSELATDGSAAPSKEAAALYHETIQGGTPTEWLGHRAPRRAASPPEPPSSPPDNPAQAAVTDINRLGFPEPSEEVGWRSPVLFPNRLKVEAIGHRFDPLVVRLRLSPRLALLYQKQCEIEYPTHMTPGPDPERFCPGLKLLSSSAANQAAQNLAKQISNHSDGSYRFSAALFRVNPACAAEISELGNSQNSEMSISRTGDRTESLTAVYDTTLPVPHAYHGEQFNVWNKSLEKV
ncbi:UNVERIFIED_CONTAM: hypothetical protein FKN15_069522 [Acipenser sinensis]